MRHETEIWLEAIERRRVQPEAGNDLNTETAGFLHACAFVLGMNTNDFCTEVDRRIENIDKHETLSERYRA